VSLLAFMSVVVLAVPAPETFVDSAAVWLEAENAAPAAGIDVDTAKRDTAVAGAALGVHPDRAGPLACRWPFALDEALSGPQLLLRYATDNDGRYRLLLDGQPLGHLVLPSTGGWGYAEAEWRWGQVPLGADLGPGDHAVGLQSVAESRPVNLDCLALLRSAAPVPMALVLEKAEPLESVALAEWEPADHGDAQPFHLGEGTQETRIWGRAPQKYVRAYFDEFLPAIFERHLVLDDADLADGALEWIFTGEHGGFTIAVDAASVRVVQRFYDSFGLNALADGKLTAARHPEKPWRAFEAAYSGRLRGVSVVLDHQIGLLVRLNGQQVVRQRCVFDVTRHQLRYTGERGAIAGRLVRPAPSEATVRVDRAQPHQTMIGFGGITTPTAYAQLSPEGKRRWWELVCEYNVLIQREYPIGARLDPNMDNWERLDDATPHYYGDNFPNGEISDFAYIRRLRRLGGMVWFEFWALPPWATRDWQDADSKTHQGVADPETYARAMVAYCRASEDGAGAPPDVVGIQNERTQPAPVWHEMTQVLRRELDRAGFDAVEIHMSDHGHLRGGIERAKAFRASQAAWDLIDYGATHMYDYQGFFENPDGYDPLLEQWRQVTGEKPFLSSELCINKPGYQWPTYRVAFTMGQLYHKNLTLADAAAICYCWTLLNVVQPSYGWTRSLFVPDLAHDRCPMPSSHQARVFGAYSRRIRKGMARLDAVSSAPDLLASAFAGENDALTVVLLNRATAPQRVRVEAGGARFTEMEIADLYRQNDVRPAPAAGPGTPTEVVAPPGAIVTLTNVPLGTLPEGFSID